MTSKETKICITDFTSKTKRITLSFNSKYPNLIDIRMPSTTMEVKSEDLIKSVSILLKEYEDALNEVKHDDNTKT